VLAGDMLDATPEHTGTFDGVWDRAALVALPAAERPAYPGAELRAIGERPSTPEGWSAVTYRLDMP
jgi:hypothetical protein